MTTGYLSFSPSLSDWVRSPKMQNLRELRGHFKAENFRFKKKEGATGKRADRQESELQSVA